MAKKIWKFFCSAKLTVVLFVLILIPSVIGTIIQQNAEDPTQYIKIYGPTWNAIFRYLGFYDIYHDARFIVLLVLLGLNTFVCTVNRFRPRWQLMGMVMTHLGLLLILLGSLTGAIFGAKGFMAIREGETVGKMQIGQAMEDTRVLPFKVKLVDFILDRYEEPSHRLLVLNITTGKQKSYNLSKGETFPLSQSRWAGMASLFGINPRTSSTIEVKNLFHHAETDISLTEGPAQTNLRAMQFHLTRDGIEEHAFVFSDQEPDLIRRGNLGIGYRWVSKREMVDGEIEKALSFPSGPNLLVVTLSGHNHRESYPAVVGSTFGIKGSDYSVEVLRYEPDFVMRGPGQVTSKSELPNNPAILVRIIGPTGSVEQWIFSKFPSMHESADMPFDLKFVRDERFDGLSDYLLVLKAPEGSSVLARIQDGKLAARRDIEVGTPVDIEGEKYRFAVDRFFENANVSQKVVDRPDLPPRPAVEMLVKQGRQSTLYSLLADTPAEIPGYRMMYTQQERVKDFYSILQIIDADVVVAEKKIEVNDPLRYGGYAFYQSSYDSKGLSWSGLQVKKDPGVPLVYAGFVVQILGMIVIFYINPLIRRAKKS